MGSFAAKTLLAIAMRLLTAGFIEEMLLFVLEKVVTMTATKVDDELLAIVRKALKK